MSEQRHVIKRQVIELELRGDAPAQPLQDAVSRVYRQRILPLIDQRCSDLSSPDQIFRIDSLDLDLGELDPANLEDDFVAKVDAALSRELAAQIRIQERAANQANGSSRAQSHLELLAFFVHTGCLPWWADASRPGLLADNLEKLLDETPGELRLLLQKLLREAGARQRLANQYNDDQLLAISGLLVPSYAAALKRDFRDLLAGLQHARAAFGEPPVRLRQILWINILIVAGWDGQEPDTLEAFYGMVLKRVGVELGGASLLVDFRADEMPFNSQLAKIIDRLAGSNTSALTPASEAPGSRLALLQARGGQFSKTWTALTDLLPELPAARQASLEAVIDNFLSGAPVQISAQRVLRILQSSQRESPHPKTAAVLQLFRALAGDSTPLELGSTTTAEQKTIDLSFSAAEEYPVANAGLVILWPFLGHFFSHLGLLDEDRQYINIASRQRAAGLLQVVATKEPSFPEYLLPLNKLLCGLGVESVFEFGSELLDSEAQECENLLQAIIAQAPILNNMTTDGFRGSFLLRSGVLSAQDGMGLLRVERQTYDIVLERLPWNWEWVRLSWMEAPLRVEW